MAKLKVPYLVLREGRPRWCPGRGLRKRGFKGVDLRYPEGHARARQWMDDGDAMRAARELNERARQGTDGAPPSPLEDRTFRGLFEHLRRSPKFQQVAGEGEAIETKRQVGLEKLKIGRRTRDDYLRYMKRLETDWCGDIQVSDLTPDMVEEFYHDQAEAHGLASANHLMRTLKMACMVATKRLRWINFNPVSAVRMADPDGRLENFERNEIAAVIGAADWCGLYSIGDAFVMGVLGGIRKQDIIALPKGELTNGHYVVRQIKKHGVKAFVPITQPLLSRVTAMRARNSSRWPSVAHTLEIINSRTGLPYPKNAKVFGEDWRLVRAIAAGDTDAIKAARHQFGIASDPAFAFAPSVKSKLFSDTRDTAVTYLAMAGCTVPEIANTSGHSLKTVQLILDKHYFKRNAEIAGTVGNKLDAYLASSPIKWA